MKLLDPKEIKQEKSESTEQAHERTKKLARDEARLVKSVNSLRSEEIRQKKRTEQALGEANLIVRQSILAQKQEVEHLEAKKAQALKPIEDKQKDFNRQFAEIQEEKKQLEKDKENLYTEREEMLDRLETVADNEAEIKEKYLTLDKRKENISKAEEEIKRLTKVLGGNWVEYHKAVEDLNKKIKQNIAKESNIATREKAIEDRKVEQDKRDKEIQAEKTLLKSNYEALETAKRHLNIK